MPQCSATTERAITAGELAEYLAGELDGSADIPLRGLATLAQAGPADVAFVADPQRYRDALEATAAGCVLVPRSGTGALRTPVRAWIAVDDPYRAYGQASRWFGAGRREVSPGVDPSARVHPDARIAADAEVGPGVVIGARCRIGAGVVIGANSVLGARVELGEGSYLHPRVSLLDDVKVGRRAIIHSGAVLGADGFGFASTPDATWEKIEQLGDVRVGDDVEIGANSTIDRGALESTRIGNGVKIDNLVHVAHNVQIGDHTAIAGCVGIAGSARIGAHCAIGGGVGILGHLAIADRVTLHAMTLVTRSIDRPGEYASGVPHQEARLWNRMLARLRRLARTRGA
ncbi:UDP-3-O-(3-hydroxymyristoyl)glucosamine N-acyltransferase [Thioalkalivibrio sp. ARh3]|uniref:UDP-3-O-(3-hydroxymyristoyl)glucosamine N-acyltransferase n=1 Tax=Thioalkalivibrio sp. ARh3 TaxID=1158148 RepID=UPI00037032CB|nr:UDP-3-O-(3-hydroxymyristoyl)glucosamine N-acyltransferase [Thioalkalivibrio sp. ARh3]